MNHKIKVRFAPSPTGYLHVGGARTAIFNWLFARNARGSFHLRIEDTDRERSNEDSISAIYDGLRWLGLDWDDEPVIQSTRTDRHKEEALRLKKEGKAYYCYCSQAELAQKRFAAEQSGTAHFYDRTCRKLSEEERAVKESAGVPKVLRFNIPDGVTQFFDMVHEETVFQNDEFDDFIILRSDGTPTYQLAVVVDDHDMGITHILRGDDHLSNTPKQLMLHRALDYDLPQFGHLPLILGPDKKRLSKREGAASVGEYRDRGYLPETMFNFLALLGWSPGDDREVMTKEELTEAFDANRILKKSSVFDEEKLRWMNGKQIRLLDDAELLRRVQTYKPESARGAEEGYLLQIIPLMKERMFFLSDLFENGKYFFEDPETFDEDAVRKHWNTIAEEQLRSLIPIFRKVDFGPQALEEAVRNKAVEAGLSAGKIIHPLRLALSGGTSSPGLFDMMVVLGRDACVRRMEKAIQKLQTQ